MAKPVEKRPPDAVPLGPIESLRFQDVVFRHRGATACRRYDLPLLHAFNFVVDEVLEGGVNASLNLDGHGKTQSFRLLALTVRVPRRLLVSAV